MVTDIKLKKKNNQNKSQNRRSRKKRRTEISSSEEDSSNSDSNDDIDECDDKNDGKVDKIKKDDIEMRDIDGDRSNIGIDNLKIVNDNSNEYSKYNYNKTDKDITQTRLKLKQIDDMNLLLNSKNSNSNDMKYNNNNKINDEQDASGIKSDEWLKLMLSEYGDDIETLRTKAADFRGESVSILAEMLRSTKDIFKEI